MRSTLAAAIAVFTVVATVLQAGSGRLAVVISDLHIGYGKDPATGQWHPTEDFRWQAPPRRAASASLRRPQVPRS
jgi:hypothetical protein